MKNTDRKCCLDCKAGKPGNNQACNARLVKEKAALRIKNRELGTAYKTNVI